MKNLQEKRRLRWQCRRGMLELDLILESFLNKNYANLTAYEQDLFEQLLDYSDQELCDCLIKRIAIKNKPMQALIEQVIRCGC
jgi:antitoxin CptB